jgi:hypothetical protein
MKSHDVSISTRSKLRRLQLAKEMQAALLRMIKAQRDGSLLGEAAAAGNKIEHDAADEMELVHWDARRDVTFETA